MSDPATVVFGLDGAHFELIDPWIEAGHLPNVRRVVIDGVTADLESVLPPVTSPNWKAYATGKNPGKIGIYWWENVDTNGQRVYYPSERKHVNVEFWELIAESEPVGVIGVPTTYPPKAVDGFLVAGAPDGEDDGYTHPPNLEATLEDRFGYRVLKRKKLSEDGDAAAEEILELIDSRFEVARTLFDEHDVAFLQATTFYLNSLHHFRWDDEYTRRAWELIDDHLGHFLDEGHNVVLMSDHGSNEIRTVFHVNTWLEREGYLTLDAGAAETLHRLGVTRDTLSRLAGAVGARRLAKQLVPSRLLDSIPDAEGTVRRAGKTDNVDWPTTTALASGQGPVYLTLDPDDPDYKAVRNELIDQLESLTDPEGNPIADTVYRGEHVYEGPYLDEAPDLVIDQAPGVHLPGDIGRDSVFTRPQADGWRAENKRAGLFAAAGPAFTSEELYTISILDLAPTLLHLHGQPVPTDMDGDVRKALFAEGSDHRTRDVEYRSVSERDREKRRIRRVARRLDL